MHNDVRRGAGAVLTVLGAVTIVWSASVVGREAAARDRVRAAWAAEEARVMVAQARSSVLPAAGWTAALGAPIGRLIIPSIGLDEVVLAGVEDRHLAVGPGHLPGSAYPGDAGNAIISAHRDKHFRTVGGVQIGDTIVTRTRHGSDTWKVVSRRVVGQNTPALFATDEPTLTLTTCWPVRFFGPAPDRLLITAVPLRAPSLRLASGDD